MRIENAWSSFCPLRFIFHIFYYAKLFGSKFPSLAPQEVKPRCHNCLLAAGTLDWCLGATTLPRSRLDGHTALAAGVGAGPSRGKCGIYESHSFPGLHYKSVPTGHFRLLCFSKAAPMCHCLVKCWTQPSSDTKVASSKIPSHTRLREMGTK